MRNFAQITFTGLNVERLLNVFSREKIALFNVRRLGGKTTEITVEYAKERKAVAILKEKCYNILSIRHFGSRAALLAAKRHAAVFIALILLFAAIPATSDLCLRIEVKADIPRQQVLSALSDCGVYVGSVVPKNVDALENSLASAFSAAYAIVSRRGSTLFVEIVARTDSDAAIDWSQPCDVVASCDAVVSRIAVLRGTAVVSAGDKVFAGQVLIKGETTYSDGTSTPCHAMGQVYGRVAAQAIEEYSPTTVKIVPTGQEVRRTEITLFSSHGEPPYKLYRRTVESAAKFGALTVETVLYEQLEEKVFQQTFSEALPGLKESALQKALKATTFVPDSTIYGIFPDRVEVQIEGEISIGRTAGG